MQGGKHATLLPQSNLRFVVHSSRPLCVARPCERKEGLDTFFSSRDKLTKVFARLSLGCSKEETEAYTSKQ